MLRCGSRQAERVWSRGEDSEMRIALLVGVGSLLGCLGPGDPYPCQSDANCFDHGRQGTCHASALGSFCAYTDSACSSSQLRWSAAAPPSLAGTCVDTTQGDGGVPPDLTGAA